MRLILAATLAFAAACANAKATDEQLFVPVFPVNFPDPFILPVKGEFLAYATNAEGGKANVQMARSANLVDWSFERDGENLHDAMPVLPTWARSGRTWAPEVVRQGKGYQLYFTANEKSSGLQCVGVAESNDPRGPFTSSATEPLVCQRETGGTIDPTVFTDTDGSRYIYYKNDGNRPEFAQKTTIWGQRLAPDGRSVVGQPKALLLNDKPWEAHVIESPTVVRHSNGYVLFYSANHYGWEEDQRLSPYAMGYANCAGPLGPCKKAPNNPILHSFNDRKAGCLSGPGHQAVFTAGGREFIVFHAHIASPGCRRTTRGRQMYVAPLLWDGDTPQVGISLRGPK